MEPPYYKFVFLWFTFNYRPIFCFPPTGGNKIGIKITKLAISRIINYLSIIKINE